MSKALRAAGDVIRSSAFDWNSITAAARAFAAASPFRRKRSTSAISPARRERPAACTPGGGAGEGAAQPGALGSAFTVDGAQLDPRYAAPAEACILGRHTYGGTPPRGPSFRVMMAPYAGNWLFG